MERSGGAMKRKPKFRVGQVVNILNEGIYLRIVFRFQCAEGVGRGLRWWYRLLRTDQINTVEFPQNELRKLRLREAGR